MFIGGLPVSSECLLKHRPRPPHNIEWGRSSGLITRTGLVDVPPIAIDDSQGREYEAEPEPLPESCSPDEPDEADEADETDEPDNSDSQAMDALLMR